MRRSCLGENEVHMICLTAQKPVRLVLFCTVRFVASLLVGTP